MPDDERIEAVKALLADHVRSPSLRHVRDPYSLDRLAKEIVRRVDRGNAIWRKWIGQRDEFLRSTIFLWIPIEDVRDFLNGMPGPKLTKTDVAQRLLGFEQAANEFAPPNPDLQAECLAIYQKEKADGTEMAAIVSLLREHVEMVYVRAWEAEREQAKRERDEARIAREQRLLSGADCPWTQLHGSEYKYCRVNGRTYRLSPTEDKKWSLSRVNSVADDEKGSPPLGKYQRREDATKVLDKLAYEPEPKW